MRVAKPLKALIKASESDSTGPEQICMQWLDTRSELSSLSASHYGNAANKKQMLLYFEKNLSRALTAAHFGSTLLQPDMLKLNKAKQLMTKSELNSALVYITGVGQISETWLIEWIACGINILNVGDFLSF